jgi:hypothetical protein
MKQVLVFLAMSVFCIQCQDLDQNKFGEIYSKIISTFCDPVAFAEALGGQQSIVEVSKTCQDHVNAYRSKLQSLSALLPTKSNSWALKSNFSYGKIITNFHLSIFQCMMQVVKYQMA